MQYGSEDDGGRIGSKITENGIISPRSNRSAVVLKTVAAAADSAAVSGLFDIAAIYQ